MDKRRAIQILTSAADLYKDNLEDQKVLFLYGVPSEVKKQLLAGIKNLAFIKGYEVAFHRHNFLHLTGVRLNGSKVASSIHFYEKCVNNRLSESDFFFARDGSTQKKLDIIENLMKIKKNAAMLGAFTDRGPKLFTERVVGNICGCMGFVEDKRTKLNVPNTVLKKDIRDVTAFPLQKVYAVFSKDYLDEKYVRLDKLDKSINLQEHFFSEEIEKWIERA